MEKIITWLEPEEFISAFWAVFPKSCVLHDLHFCESLIYFLSFLPYIWQLTFHFSLYIVSQSFTSSFVKCTFCLTSWESLRIYHRNFLSLKYYVLFLLFCYLSFFHIDFLLSFLSSPPPCNQSLNIMKPIQLFYYLPNTISEFPLIPLNIYLGGVRSFISD